ncbi:MAG TPA: DUF6119 family protein [Candidatus Limnocylindria bacterium]|nr:DUF6119 family protein [Candidatus Limnocylindria bacterium]
MPASRTKKPTASPGRSPRIAALTVFLLRREIEDARQALGGRIAEEFGEVELRRLPIDARLFVRRSVVRHPWWESFFASVTREPLVVKASTAGAILFVTVAKQLFAFTFGTGRFALDPSSYERDFGLRVTLNAVDPRALRSIDMQTVEELTLFTQRQASRSSGLEVFQLDEIRDMLRGVVGQPKDPSLAQLLAGSDRLALRARVRLTDLATLCERLQELYGSNVYKDAFGFIDQMRRVTEPDLLASLDERLVQALEEPEDATLHMAPPEPIDWEDFGGYRYEPIDKDAPPRGDLDVVELVETFEEARKRSLELDDLRKRVRVVSLSAATGQPAHHWSLYDTMVTEFAVGDQRYVLSGGDWFEVSATFAEQTAAAVNALPTSAIAFPSSPKGEVEAQYLTRAVPLLEAGEGIGYALMDQKLVACTGAPSRIEVCDLLNELKQFIHVKRRTASATLSHLFAQGTTSATAFIGDRGFRLAARDELPAAWDAAAIFPEDQPIAGEYTVTYAVIARGNGPLGETLPFFSQVNLTHASRILRTMGFAVELAHIEETPAP